MKYASTDTSRKIASLRRMSRRLQEGKMLGNAAYLDEIADDMERIYLLMIDARRRLLIIERYPTNRRVKMLATI